ncbi:unnamed protein product [Miscanthus lutarioriparius]|uniref:Uncharacterized protein n=1 Tax=Miscanthus lutarioriparius TaxID=422564 RepID=A0A811SGX8_9POAL|nr:unnamed protein product [Miscanthus lutarioriparius]
MAGLQGEDVIAILPWEEWWEFEVTKDDSNPQIALLPLHPDLRAKFNETAAWIYAKSMNGKPYGFDSAFCEWFISFVTEIFMNDPQVASVMTVWTKLQPEYAGNMWEEALNKRLETKGLHLSEIIVESEKRGITFDKLLTVPENDSWVYEDGRSASCIAFVLMMYKEAGLFDPITSSVEVTEFTVSAPESLCSSLWPYIGTFVRAKGSGGDICVVNASISLSSAQWNAGLSFC